MLLYLISQELFTDVKMDENSNSIKIKSVTSCDGEARVTNRKNKLFVFFEWNITLAFEGESFSYKYHFAFKQILSSSVYLSFIDRDIADTMITFHHTTIHHKVFQYLRDDLYSSVIHHWNYQLKAY